MISQAGEIWLANIPFTNGIASKIRPVLVLWLDDFDVVVSSVTSSPPRTPTDVLLQEWVEAGLRVPSTVRLSRLDYLEQKLLRLRLGTPGAGERERVKQVRDIQLRLRF
jgi:mRNA interferase MazF